MKIDLELQIRFTFTHVWAIKLSSKVFIWPFSARVYDDLQ